MIDDSILLAMGTLDRPGPPREDSWSKTIGGSNIGHPCDACVTLTLRSFPTQQKPEKLQRIFALGYAIEKMILERLHEHCMAAGLTLVPGGDESLTYFSHDWRVKVKADGAIDSGKERLALIEIKSANERRFSDMATYGVELGEPGYYEQVQLEMGMSGIRKTLFIAYNKNTSDIHREVVHFDPFLYSSQLHRIESILGGAAMRCAASDTDWRCKFCDHRSTCWAGFDTVKLLHMPGWRACRTCKHSIPLAPMSTPGAAPECFWCAKNNRVARSLCTDYDAFTVTPHTET